MTSAEHQAEQELRTARLDLRMLEAGERVVGRRAIAEVTARHRKRRQLEFEASRPLLHHAFPGCRVRIR